MSVLGNADTAKAGFDTIDLVDPTPISGSLSAGMSYAKGEDDQAKLELGMAMMGPVGDVVKRVGKGADVAKGTLNLAEEASEQVAKHGDEVVDGGKKIVPKEGIYEFPDAKADDLPYVGQSGNISERLQTHRDAGRLAEDTVAETTEVLGGKTAREIAEHKRIQEITGGVPARKSPDVSNKKDLIGPRRRDLLDDD